MQQRFEHVGVKGVVCKGAGYEGFELIHAKWFLELQLHYQTMCKQV